MKIYTISIGVKVGGLSQYFQPPLEFFSPLSPFHNFLVHHNFSFFNFYNVSSRVSY